MTTRYLLDTNIVSALLREPHGLVFERIRAVGEANVCTSVVVSSELRFGAAKRGSPRLLAQLEAVLSALEVLPLEPAVDAAYAETRWRLEQRGTPVGATICSSRRTRCCSTSCSSPTTSASFAA